MDKIGEVPELYNWMSQIEEKDTWCEYMYLFNKGKLLKFAAHGFTNLVADYSDILHDQYVEYWLWKI